MELTNATATSFLVDSGLDVEPQSFTWRIKNFSVIRKSKSLINSQEFSFTAGESLGHSSKWRLFLQETIEDGKRWIGVFHHIVEPSPANTWEQCCAEFRYAIKKEDETTSLVSELKPGKTMKEIPTYVRGWGWTKVIEADNGTICSDDNLTIRFDFTLCAPTKPRMGPPRPQPVKPTTVESLQAKFATKARRDLAKLLENPIPCNDLKLVSNDEVEFTAQKGILAVRSPVFEAMLRTEMTERKEGVVQLPDISGKMLRVLLNFIYTGELLPAWSEAEVLVELTNSAAKYQLNDLLAFLDVTLGKVCCLENALALMVLSNQLSLKTAQVEILNFIQEKSLNSPAVFSEMLEGIPAPAQEVCRRKSPLRSVLKAITCPFRWCLGSGNARKKEMS